MKSQHEEPDCVIAKQASPNDGDGHAIRVILRDYNIAQTSLTEFETLVLQLKDAQGTVLGGLIGEYYWGWFSIKTLAVDEKLRGKGYGKQLMLAAEEDARSKGIKNIWLDTMSFQARPFYESLGYEVFGQLDDYPPGHQRFFMKKTLTDVVPQED